jgi:hypothetical protein
MYKYLFCDKILFQIERCMILCRSKTNMRKRFYVQPFVNYWSMCTESIKKEKCSDVKLHFYVRHLKIAHRFLKLPFFFDFDILAFTIIIRDSVTSVTSVTSLTSIAMHEHWLLACVRSSVVVGFVLLHHRYRCVYYA